MNACAKCRGEGWVEVVTGGDWISYCIDTEMVRCDACNGTGATGLKEETTSE